MNRIAFITPPLIKPSEPGLSAAAAAGYFRASGLEAVSLDASLGWYCFSLHPNRLETLLIETQHCEETRTARKAFHQALRDLRAPEHPLRQARTYQSKKVYSSAINHLQNALNLAALPFPGFHLRIADLEVDGKRPQDSQDLEELAGTSSPFDDYFLQELIPQLEGFTHVGLSLTFLNQAFAAFRLAFLLKEVRPDRPLFLGGPLLACWAAVGAPLDRPIFQLFTKICPSDEAVEALVQDLGGSPPGSSYLLAPALDEVDWSRYLVPQPTIPMAMGRGCYWRRCAFCPDYLHPAYREGDSESLGPWLESLVKRFPTGAMLHLTDSALTPRLMDLLARHIRERQLPIRWHGFVRMEARFQDPTFVEHLAAGGCVMLQWGLETASPRLLDLMNKGLTPKRAEKVLQTTAAAGIKNHVYLMFGLPTETDVERQLTLDFVRREAVVIHDLNASILNLPRRSPLQLQPESFGITQIQPFGRSSDLSLYDDFFCGESHPRLEARQWLGRVFFKDEAVRGILGNLNAPFKANHSCFL